MDSSIFQSHEWEQFKLKTGYSKSYRVDDVLILQRNLPLGQAMLYSPMVSESQENGVRSKEYLNEIKRIGKENNAIFYRLELNIPKMEKGGWKMENLRNFVKSFEEMQPENNWLLDLRQSEGEILTNMKQKGRYNIKIAERNNLTVTSSSSKTSKELDTFYTQYSETGNRHKITYRGKKYFEALLEILGQSDYARTYAVWKGKTPLASAIILLYGESALYLYGGSSEQSRELMAPYLLHWTIIKEAKEKGFSEYNFLGVAPNDDSKHDWAGITRFKKQFGGYQEDIMGSYDLVFNPIKYKLFKIAEKIRRK